MNEWFDAEQRAERAQQLTESHRWAEALAELDAALDINPSNINWQAQRGFLLDQLERFDEAVQAYRDVLESEPEDRETLLALGIDLERVGRLSESASLLERLRRFHPNFEPGFCFGILVHAELEQHERAEELFYLAQQLQEDCPNCFYHMGISLAERGEFERAVYCWGRVLSIDPGFEGVHGQMARAYRAAGDLASAQEWYLKAIREDPGDIELLFEMGTLLVEREKIDLAVIKFRQVLELAPDHVDGQFALSEVLLHQNAGEEALELLESVSELDSEYPGLALRIGAARLKLGQRDEALPFLEQAVEDAPTNKEALMLLGNCFLWLQRPEKAADQFRRIIALDNSLANVYHNLGVCCFLTNDHEQGIRHCRRALELKPDYLLAIVKLVLAYQRLGQFAESKEMIRCGLRVDRDNSLLKHLGRRMWRARLKYYVRRLGASFRVLFGRG